ncbi:transcriptional regulator, BadM/Rrf2 family protein [unidentified eubacterium SCB49]|nr:transcriptional regulator, BadM/Rrf2 family protein [unidentified eubacterium SCB49]
MFSKTCRYGIKATIYIAQQSQEGKRASLKEIAEAIDSPVAFTAKVLQFLSKAAIINATKGFNGGYSIEKELLEKITLKQIVKAIDGDQLFEECALGLSICNANEPCPMHDQFVNIRAQLNNTLAASNLLSVVKELALGNTVLKR